MSPPESTVWECHGTGTSLGDPIEVGAVKKVQIRHQRLEPLMIASVKSNIGHLEGGAGMSAMCKCVIQCQRTMCCPTLHLQDVGIGVHMVFCCGTCLFALLFLSLLAFKSRRT